MLFRSDFAESSQCPEKHRLSIQLVEKLGMVRRNFLVRTNQALLKTTTKPSGWDDEGNSHPFTPLEICHHVIYLYPNTKAEGMRLPSNAPFTETFLKRFLSLTGFTAVRNSNDSLESQI